MFALIRVLGVLSLIATFAAPVFAEKEVILKYGDGVQDNKRSMAGAGQAVRFECPDGEKWYVKAVAIYGSRYGAYQAPSEDFQVVVASDDLSRRAETHKPYSLFKRGEDNEKWVRFAIDPVEVQGAFQVVAFFNPTQTKGVYVGIDKDSTPSHSSIVLASNPGKKESDLEGDWMIRAYLSKEPSGEAKSLLDDAARAEQKQKRETESDAKLLGDARSLALQQDDGPTDDHLNIQGALYTVAFDTPKNVAGYVWQVQIYASQFGGQHDSEAVSGDVYVLDENRTIISRTTFPYSRATQQKQWISIPTLPTKVQGKFYVSVDAHGTQFKGLYMGYQKGNAKQVASTDARQGDRVEPADWSEKYADKQWLIRVKLADRPVVY